MKPIVILGTGLAGYTLAKEFRKLDTQTPLLLITADDGSFYSKPMLSNALAKGKTAADLATASAEAMAAQLNAEVRTHTRVTTLSPERRRLSVGTEEIAYDRLVLCLGADPLRIPLQGNASDEVLSVNDLDDYARFRTTLEGKHRVCILGGGLIGCEFANDLANAGFAVTVSDLAERPLGRLLPPGCAKSLQDALSEAGVCWKLGRGARNVSKVGNSYAVELDNGELVESDLVLSAVGLRPRTKLAQTAGLEVGRGIVTDRLLATSDPHIFALGDCLEVEGRVLPFVMPIMNAARALAKTLAGTPTLVRYPAMPVVVKTPSHPVVVSPPAPDAKGNWRTEKDKSGSAGFFENAAGDLLGFALTGDRVSEKQALTKQLPPVMD